MKPRLITDDVYLLGAVDWDRRLFDALIPLPDGTSYNAYFVQGAEKNVLLDTVDTAKCRTLMAQLDTLPAPDYLVIHHVEQDHSGCTPALLDRFPELTVVCNEKARGMLVDHLHVDDARFHVVADGDTLELGGKTLTFLFTPWVHWPETMSTWLEQDRILFSCDFFGSHYATNDVFADKHEVYDGAKRYYAEIMMPFGGQVLKNIEKVTKYPIRYIGPSHGPVYNDPAFIIEAYKDWAGGEPQNIVCLPFVSMHDSTLLMVDHLTSALTDRGVAVERFDLTTLDAGELATLAGARRHHRARHADRAHRAAPAGRLRGVPGQRAQAAHQVRHGDRVLRLGRQDGRDAGRHDGQAQVRVPRAGDGQGHAAGRGLRGARESGRPHRREAQGPAAAQLRAALGLRAGLRLTPVPRAASPRGRARSPVRAQLRPRSRAALPGRALTPPRRPGGRSPSRALRSGSF